MLERLERRVLAERQVAMVLKTNAADPAAVELPDVVTAREEFLEWLNEDPRLRKQLDPVMNDLHQALGLR